MGENDLNKIVNEKTSDKIQDNTKIKTKEKKQENINIKFHVLAIFCILIFSFALTPITFQNDTYYTISIGEHIIQNGNIDMQDPFSWHEGLPYTYPHWAYDVGTYLIYNLGETIGLRRICSNLYYYNYLSNVSWCSSLLHYEQTM